MMTDPVADMLTRIRNGCRARKRSVDIPSSGFKKAIAEALLRERFIRDFKVVDDGKQGILRIYLKYADNQGHVIQELVRISKPSRRVYVGADEVKSVYNGMGTSILSTSKGILTDKQARKQKVGGEVLCNIF